MFDQDENKKIPSLLDNAPNYLFGCVIQKRTPEKNCFFYFRALCQDCKGFYQVISVL